MALKILSGPLRLGNGGGLQIKGGASAFSPLSLSPALWLKADAGTSSTVDGTALTQWNDQSGNARHATATGTDKPVYKAAIVNGKPVIRFTAASSQYWTLPDFLTGFTAGEIFVIVKPNVDPAASQAASGLYKFGSSAQSPAYPFTDGIVYDDFGATARKTTVNPTPSLAAWRLYNVISAAGEWTSNLDGTQLFTTATNTVGWTTAPRIGRAGVSAVEFLDGDLAEVCLFSSKLSTLNRTSMKSYFATKYGLTIA